MSFLSTHHEPRPNLGALNALMRGALMPALMRDEVPRDFASSSPSNGKST